MSMLAFEPQTMADVERGRAIRKRFMALREAPQRPPAARPRAVKGSSLPAEKITWEPPPVALRPAPPPERVDNDPEPAPARPDEEAGDPVQARSDDAEGLPPELSRRLTIDFIARLTCAHFGVSMQDLLSNRRPPKIVIARHVAMYLAKTHTTRSLPFIARQLGKMDHTTILHAVRKIEEMQETDGKLREDLAALSAAIEAWRQS